VAYIRTESSAHSSALVTILLVSREATSSSSIQNEPTVIIPRHNPVKVGLLIDQIRAAELTIEEFERLL
jgi:hypothetical protein